MELKLQAFLRRRKASRDA